MLRITVRRGIRSALLHALRATYVGCACGSTNVHAEPGAFGEMGSAFGLSRFWCRDCRKHFWLRSTLLAESEGVCDDPEPNLMTRPRHTYKGDSAADSLRALDIIQTSAQAPKATDLLALDRYIQQAQGSRQKSTERRDSH